MSQAQATAILDEFAKAGETVGASQVTEIIKRHGVRAEAVKKIELLSADKTLPFTIILLTDLKDWAQARHMAVGDSTMSIVHSSFPRTFDKSSRKMVDKATAKLYELRL